MQECCKNAALYTIISRIYVLLLLSLPLYISSTPLICGTILYILHVTLLGFLRTNVVFLDELEFCLDHLYQGPVCLEKLLLWEVHFRTS